MRKFDLDDYDPVQARIPKFLEKYPDGRIITALESGVNDINTVVFKAELWNKDILLSTGWAFETRDLELKISNRGGEYESVNYTSHLENCETSAIGRALANIGINGNKRPSREEMGKVQRMQIQRMQKTKPEPKKDKKINVAQCGLMQTEINARGLDIAKVLVWASNKYKIVIMQRSDILASQYDAVMANIRSRPLLYIP